MAQLRLPDGATAGFRLDLTGEFGERFTIHIYGARRGGWFIAADTGYFGPACSVGPRPLVRGQWRGLLGLVKRAAFWDRPARWPLDTSTTWDGGGWLTLAGRNPDRYHEVLTGAGDTYTGRGLSDIARFLSQLSGLAPALRPPLFGLGPGSAPGDAPPAGP